MLREWIKASLEYSAKPADFYSGARKIIRGRSIVFEEVRDDLRVEDAGYTQSKLTLLRKSYLHEESRTIAMQLWERRLGQKKYGSVGFTTYNHFLKTDPNRKSKRASVMGPCIQSVCLTLLANGRTSVDVFYRTTELFKKFPADLVFIRDDLLKDFEVDIETMTFYFANITAHPMYFVTIIPHLEDPIREMEVLRKRDEYFYRWAVKWAARYLCDEYHRGIAKFAQAMRVCKDARSRISADVMPDLKKYLVENHPGYRNEYEAPEDDDD